MENKRRVQKEVKDIFRAKHARRRALAKLSFDEKIRILVELQTMASDIGAAEGAIKHRAWNIR